MRAKKSDELIPLYRAARLLGMCEIVLSYEAAAGKIECIRDAKGRRYLTRKELERFAKSRGRELKERETCCEPLGDVYGVDLEVAIKEFFPNN